MSLHEKTLTFDKQTVHYWEDGAHHERCVLLLHGGMGDARFHWEPCIPLLAEQFRVIAPDLPGFGGSTALPNLTIDQLMDWIKQLFAALHIEQMALVGNDFGALLARLFSAAYPQAVPALVLVNGGAIPNIPASMRFLARLPLVGNVLFYTLARSTFSPTQLPQVIFAGDVLTEDFKSTVQANSRPYGQILRMLAADRMPEKRQPLLPTLLLWGSNDSIAPQAEAERMQGTIPGAQLATIAECGHMPQLEACEVFAWQLVQFLNDPGRSNKPTLPGVGLL